MHPEIADVLSGSREWAVVESDCVAFLDSLPADSVSLVMGSPPYRLARTYGIDFNLADQAWVDWMLKVFTAASRVCTGLVCMVVEGQTKDFRWTAEPALLLADLHRAGFNLRKPPVYKRVGIPGSGGPDWLRNDWEWCVCVTRPGKLLWSDNTAMGHPPKWAPGGEMNYRDSKGNRKNSVPRIEAKNGDLVPSAVVYKNGPPTQEERENVGSHRARRQAGYVYVPPKLANPGNVIECLAGGFNMGDQLTHENEAPYPEKLAEFFVKSFCPLGGVTCDPFSGSGTTCAVSVRNGRRFVGCDVRASQVELTKRRVIGGNGLTKDVTLPAREAGKLPLFEDTP